MTSPVLHDQSRAVVRIYGEDAPHFLANIITNHLPDDGKGVYAGLLTPQGKLLFDFFLARKGEEYLADVREELADDFLKRLGIYRLRAKVKLERADYAVLLGDGVSGIISFPDPRHESLGLRTIAHDAGDASTDLGAYHTRRISLGIPEGGEDFSYGEVFVHEVNMDLLNGIDFKKGCYVGQEVVSRVHHKGGARKRIIQVRMKVDVEAPCEILAGGKAIGTLTSEVITTSGMRGLAMIRLDKAHKAIIENSAITADGVALELEKPSWMTLPFPGEADFAADGA